MGGFDIVFIGSGCLGARDIRAPRSSWLRLHWSLNRASTGSFKTRCQLLGAFLDWIEPFARIIRNKARTSRKRNLCRIKGTIVIKFLTCFLTTHYAGAKYPLTKFGFTLTCTKCEQCIKKIAALAGIRMLRFVGLLLGPAKEPCARAQA